MRKIEAQLTDALRLGREFKSRNTTITNTDHGQIVRLHGNKIAQVDGSTLYITSAGYETATTKSRLNAILGCLLPSTFVYQRDFVWYVSIKGDSVEFSELEGEPIQLC